jgi:hypothetical protein
MNPMNQIVLAALLALASFGARAQVMQAAPPADQPTVATVEECAVYFGANGEQEMPKLKVLGISESAKFKLTPDAPADVKVVACRRDAIVPARNDYKVLEAGYAFAIISGGRAVTLEMVQGQPKMRLVTGALTETEKALMKEFFAHAREKLVPKAK